MTLMMMLMLMMFGRHATPLCDRTLYPVVKWRFELGVTQLVLPQPIGLCGPHHQTGVDNKGEAPVLHTGNSSSSYKLLHFAGR